MACILLPDRTARAQQELSAEDIFERVRRVYAECSSYRDSGTAITDFFKPMMSAVTRPFTTAFVRPSRFRFEFREKHLLSSSRFIIWQNGPDVQTWWNLHHPNVRHPDGIQAAVSGATGISGTSSFQIPALLLPDKIKGGRPLTVLTDLHRMDDAPINGAAMYRIRGSHTVEMTIWIEPATFLIRRIEFDTPQAHQTIDYSPAVNVEIPPQQLAFRPR
jgi:hypothetical protein